MEEKYGERMNARSMGMSLQKWQVWLGGWIPQCTFCKHGNSQLAPHTEAVNPGLALGWRCCLAQRLVQVASRANPKTWIGKRNSNPQVTWTKWDCVCAREFACSRVSLACCSILLCENVCNLFWQSYMADRFNYYSVRFLLVSSYK